MVRVWKKNLHYHIFQLLGKVTEYNNSPTLTPSKPIFRAAQAIFGCILPVAAVIFAQKYSGLLGGQYMADRFVIVALFMTSPFAPFTLWALATQNVRDQALPKMNSFIRAFALVPYLATSKDSQIKTATWLNLLGLAVAAIFI